MKRFKRILAVIIYVAFSYGYALRPDIRFRGGFSIAWHSFHLETFVMMLFVGVYLTAFWVLINRLFRN